MVKRGITRIPYPGGSGQTPTGALQFQDDWPGLFIRGDDAIILLAAIEQLEQLLCKKCKDVLPSKLEEIATIIKQDVLVRPDLSP